MRVLIWIMTGIAAGWLTRLIMRGRAYGLVGDLLLGSLGGITGGLILRSLGAAPADRWENVAVAVVGAIVLLGAVRLLVRVSRHTGLLRRDQVTGAGIIDLESQVRRLGDLEKKIFSKVLRRESTAINANVVFDAQLTFGQQVADRVARFGGSWTFIGSFLLMMLFWMIFNTETGKGFYPFPFVLLNLILSCVAALQAPIIMMSQNRQSAKDRLEVQQAFEVNLRNEMELVSLQAKLDTVRENDIPKVAELQERQLAVLERLEKVLQRLEPRSP